MHEMQIWAANAHLSQTENSEDRRGVCVNHRRKRYGLGRVDSASSNLSQRLDVVQPFTYVLDFFTQPTVRSRQ